MSTFLGSVELSSTMSLGKKDINLLKEFTLDGGPKGVEGKQGKFWDREIAQKEDVLDASGAAVDSSSERSCTSRMNALASGSRLFFLENC